MKKRKITIVVLLFMLLQSCTVYQKTSVSIEEATNKGKVKLENNNGLIWKFNKIEQIDSIYYGIVKGDTLEITPANITKINPIDERKSLLLRIHFWIQVIHPSWVLTLLIIMSSI